MEGWKDGIMGESIRKNKNRGYRKLRVWNDAIDFYVQTSRVFRQFPYDLRRVSSQSIASADSIHRNIAEGYCRRSIKEYLYHLNIALGSLGESVSALHAYKSAHQLSREDFEILDAKAYKLENGLLKLIETLQMKRDRNDWIEDFKAKESTAVYEGSVC